MVDGRCRSAKPGQCLLMENTRFHAGEESNDPALAKIFASLGDTYVNDAFSAAHRAHASTEGVAHLLPAYAGRAMDAVGRLLEIEQEKGGEAAAAAHRAASSARFVMIAVLIGGLAVALLLARFLTRLIVRPLRRVKDVLTTVAAYFGSPPIRYCG